MDKEEKKAYNKKYNLENKEILRELYKKYNQEHKELRKEWRRENQEQIKKYRQENKEYFKRYCQENKEYFKRYRQENKESMKELQKKWFKEHPEKVKVYNSNRRARKKSNGGSFTATEILELIKKSKGFCKGYKRKPHFVGEEKLTIDHIIPLIKGGRNDIKNIQLLCLSCNDSKGVN